MKKSHITSLLGIALIGVAQAASAATFGVVSACLLALPSFLKTGVETAMGSGATMGSLNGSRIQ